MIHRIKIPNWRPTPDNKLTGGSHWGKKHRLKTDDKEFVAAYALHFDVPRALGKRTVQLEIVLSGKEKQADPMAYCKSLLDALVACGQLIDDTAEFVEWVPPIYSRGEESSTTIVLEDME